MIRSERLIAQLEEPKFLRFFRILMGERDPLGVEGRSPGWAPADRLDAIGLRSAELWRRTLGGEMAQAIQWFFQIEHLPPSLCDGDMLPRFLASRLWDALQEAATRPEVRRLFERTYACDAFCAESEHYYYFFSNIEHDYLHSVPAARLVHQVARRTLGRHFARLVDQFGIGSPGSIAAGNPRRVEDGLVDILNAPSGYYVLAREGELSVVPVTHHGLFLSSSREGPVGDTATGFSASLFSSLRGSGAPALTAIAGFEQLIRDARATEADIQKYLEEYPSFSCRSMSATAK